MKKLPWVEHWKDVGTALAPDGVQFLENLVDYIDRCMEEKVAFQTIMASIAHDIDWLWRHDCKLALAKKQGFTPKTSAKMAKGFAKGHLTKDEVEFLGDIKGFISYGVRNGVTLSVIIAFLGHDVNELKLDCFDFRAAEKRGFGPKVGGYAEVTADSWQDPGQD